MKLYMNKENGKMVVTQQRGGAYLHDTQLRERGYFPILVFGGTMEQIEQVNSNNGVTKVITYDEKTAWLKSTPLDTKNRIIQLELELKRMKNALGGK